MSLFNPSDNSIHLKVVYYGPGYGGKTTNLTRVKRILDPNGSTDVLSLNTDRDTTLFFDYLPLSFKLLDRYAVRVQGYTVPGQVKFNATRRLVLKGADGIVFVADSRREALQDDVESYLNLHGNLAQLGMSPARVPIVVQFNKRDCADALPVAELDRLLNQEHRPSVPAVALTGEGVFETFQAILHRMMEAAHAEYQLDRLGLSIEDALAALDEALLAGANACIDSDVERRAEVVQVESRNEDVLMGERGNDALLDGAVETNLKLADIAARTADRETATRVCLDELRAAGQRLHHAMDAPLESLEGLMTRIRGMASEAAIEPADAALLELKRLKDEFSLWLSATDPTQR